MQNNDYDIFKNKYEQYSNMLYKICVLYLKNNTDTEDVIHDAFIKLLYNSPEFPSQEDEKRWLIRVTINECKNVLKSKWRRNINIEDFTNELKTDDDRQELLKLILTLNPKNQIVIQLFYYEGYSVKEISDILKIRESAVKQRLKRGRDSLKLDLEMINNE